MITKNVTLWLGAGPPVYIPVSQGDTMWAFNFSIIYEDSVWTPPAGATAVMTGRASDEETFEVSGTVSGNNVIVNATDDMTGTPGPAVCELSITADEKVVSTANFMLLVEPAPAAE